MLLQIVLQLALGDVPNLHHAVVAGGRQAACHRSTPRRPTRSSRALASLFFSSVGEVPNDHVAGPIEQRLPADADDPSFDRNAMLVTQRLCLAMVAGSGFAAASGCGCSAFAAASAAGGSWGGAIDVNQNRRLDTQALIANNVALQPPPRKPDQTRLSPQSLACRGGEVASFGI